MLSPGQGQCMHLLSTVPTKQATPHNHKEECKCIIALCNIRLNYTVNIVADHKLTSVPDQPSTSNVLAVVCRVLTLSGDP